MNAAKDQCVNGHPFNERNTYIRPGRNGNRDCRTCTNLRGAEYRKRKQLAMKGGV